MTRSTRILSSIALIGLSFVTIVFSSRVNARGGQRITTVNAQPSQRSAHGHRSPGPLHVSSTLSSNVGIPAIHPRFASSSSTIPDFTVADVKAYMMSATQPSITLIQGGQLTFERVTFVSSKEATQLMRGEDPGLADNALVCFVLLKGPFHVQVDQAPGTTDGNAQTATEIGVVFDAHTGNLLEWTILDTLPVSTSTHAHIAPSAPSASSANAWPTARSTAPYIPYNCDPTRCWGTNYWPNAVNGASTVLDWQFPNATRFYHGDQSDSFVQNTMWIIDETEPNNCKPAVSDLPGDCWVEAGLKAFNNNGSNATALFWADVRPGYQYADHYGAIVNTLSSTNAIDIQIWKAGTIPNVGWCPIAAAEWCVIIYSEGDGQEMTGISGVNNANRMNVSSYREGMELFGLSGAVANPMYFDFNQWEGTSNNVWHYQDNTGDYAGYKTDPPVDQLWTIYPSTSPSNAGGELMTCITGAGC